jgi:hypothetical protein
MLPVTDFTAYFSPEMVEWTNQSKTEIQKETLPAEPRIIVLNPTHVGEAT